MGLTTDPEEARNSPIDPETYARQPDYYTHTFCAGCKQHLPVGPKGAFYWDGTDERVGT